MDDKTKAMVLEWLKMHNGDVGGLARWMRDACHIGGLRQCRELIKEAIQ